MADDASSSGSAPAPGPALGSDATAEEQALVRLMDRMAGRLINPEVLDELLDNHRWLDAADYLQEALTFHPNAAQAAIAYPEDAPDYKDMVHAHPELFVLPRRQYCLELLAEGKPDQAQKYFNDSIFAPTRDARRTRYLDGLLIQLQGIATRNETQLLNLPEERRKTSRSIVDYLRVYFPAFDRGPEVKASRSRSSRPLHSTAAFGELIEGYNFRCLVCHEPLAFHSDPDNRMVLHLHRYCPNMTPAVRARLPRMNRPPWSS